MIFEHLLIPWRCPACDVTTPSFCPDCRDELELWRGAACLRCGAASGVECLCDSLAAEVVSVRSCWRFDGPVADVVEASKYAGETWRFEVLRRETVGWLRSMGAQVGAEAVWIPVPPMPRRFRRRGFDLALMLARWGARASSGRLLAAGLQRRPSDRAQAALGREARQEAVRDVFTAKRRLDDRVVVLVDDVITTGATVSASAAALAGAGVETIWILSFARTPRRIPIE